MKPFASYPPRRRGTAKARIVFSLGPRAIVAATVGVLAVSACSSSSSSSSNAAQVSGSKLAPLSLTIGTNLTAANSAQVAIGEAEGYFKQENLNIKWITGLGSGSNNALISGQIDLTTDGLSQLPLLSSEGQDPIGIRAVDEAGDAGYFAGGPGETLQKLKSQAGKCTINSLAPGSLTYGYATYYNKSLGLNCDVVPLANDTVQVSAVETHRDDALTQSAPVVTTQIAKGQMTAIINPSLPADRTKAQLPSIPEDAWVGLASNLQSKKAAVTRFLVVMDEVSKFETTHTPAELAQLVVQNSNYAPLGVATMTQEFAATMPFETSLLSGDGVLTSAMWSSWLAFESSWNISGFHPFAAYNAYDKRIDMSYLTAARATEASSGSASSATSGS
jgi:ABC-type nitrate/sulfonate/bicarbonate transport system substrate-binding protein